MSNLYIVQTDPEPYESDTIYGYYTSLDKAKECINRLKTNNQSAVIFECPIDEDLIKDRNEVNRGGRPWRWLESTWYEKSKQVPNPS